MTRFVVALLALLAATISLPAVAQLPPSGGLVVTNTPIQNGTSGFCLYVQSNGRLGNQACSTGSVSSFSAGTTGFTPSSPTSGAVVLSGVLVGANGGTGVANTGKTITLGGNLTTSGAFASTFTMTNTTAVTFPVSGTLLSTNSTIPLTVGTTTIASGTTTRVLYDNAGVLGEYSVNGTGNVLLAAGTLNITSGKTGVITNSITFSGTDSTVMTFPTTTATIARTDAAQTFAGRQTFAGGSFIESDGSITIRGNTGLNAGSAGVVTIANTSSGNAVVLNSNTAKFLTSQDSGGGFRLTGAAFASFAAAGTVGAGAMGYCTDSTTIVPGATVTGGGANKIIMWSDGTNWKVMGI